MNGCEYIKDTYFLIGNVFVTDKYLGSTFDLYTGINKVSISGDNMLPNMGSINVLDCMYSLEMIYAGVRIRHGRTFHYYRPTLMYRRNKFAMSSLFMNYFLQRNKKPGFFYKTKRY